MEFIHQQKIFEHFIVPYLDGNFKFVDGYQRAFHFTRIYKDHPCCWSIVMEDCRQGEKFDTYKYCLKWWRYQVLNSIPQPVPQSTPHKMLGNLILRTFKQHLFLDSLYTVLGSFLTPSRLTWKIYPDLHSQNLLTSWNPQSSQLSRHLVSRVLSRYRPLKLLIK